MRKSRRDSGDEELKGWSAEVDSEVSFHLERRVQRLLEQGMSEEAARSEALRRFGDVEKVKAAMRREKTGSGPRRLWESFCQDGRFALRQIQKNRLFTATAVVTLMLGIGATTAIFSVVNGILFEPLPYPEPEELLTVWSDWTQRGGPVDEWLNYPNFHELRERSRTLQAVGAWDNGALTLTGHGEPEQIPVGVVTHDTLSQVLAVKPALGRLFLPEDDEPGAPATVVLSDLFWRQTLDAEPSIEGQTLTLNDKPYTIIGVLPPGFEPPFAQGAAVWLTLGWDLAKNGCGLGNACLRAVARLAPDVSLDEARREATEIASQLAEEHKRQNSNVGLTLLPMRQDMVQDARVGLLVLLSAVGLVLLIACVNVANLLLSRATARTSELAIRRALGAGRGRLVTQLLFESALLALLGGGAGLALAYWGTRRLVALAPAGTPRLASVGVDGTVLSFALAITLLSALVFGLVPALRASKAAFSGLREGGRGRLQSGGGMKARSVLVAAQMALALMLLASAGLLLRSFQNLRHFDLGFNPRGVLTLSVGLPGSRYPDAPALKTFRAQLEDRLARLPGVEAVGVTSWLPLAGGAGTDTSFTIEGRPLPPSDQNQAVWYRQVSPGYKAALGLRLVAGRWLDDGDDVGAPVALVINEGLARRHFAGEDPLGQRLNLGSPSRPLWGTIVGVVAEARYFAIRDSSRDALYFSYDQSPRPPRRLFVALRSSRDLASLEGEVRRAVGELDPVLAVAGMTPMESWVAQALGPERFMTFLLLLFAAVALALAAVGLYGVISYGVGLRLHEMGVRLALGARAGDLRSLVLRHSLLLAAIGLVVGVAGGLFLSRFIESLLFDISPTDPGTYVAVAVLLIATAIAASALPARRASRVDPVSVLRSE